MTSSPNPDKRSKRFTLSSNREQSCADVLHKALVRLNHKSIGLLRLSIFEDPVTAVMSIKDFDSGGRIAKLFLHKPASIIISIKVTQLDQSARYFDVQCTAEQEQRKRDQTRLSKNCNALKVVEDMFLSIPNMSLTPI